MIPLAVAVVLIVNAGFFLLWPHTALRCEHGCRSRHSNAVAGNQGILIASLACLCAVLVEVLS